MAPLEQVDTGTEIVPPPPETVTEQVLVAVSEPEVTVT